MRAGQVTRAGTGRWESSHVCGTGHSCRDRYVGVEPCVRDRSLVLGQVGGSRAMCAKSSALMSVLAAVAGVVWSRLALPGLSMP